MEKLNACQLEEIQGGLNSDFMKGVCETAIVIGVSAAVVGFLATFGAGGATLVGAAASGAGFGLVPFAVSC